MQLQGIASGLVLGGSRDLAAAGGWALGVCVYRGCIRIAENEKGNFYLGFRV